MRVPIKRLWPQNSVGFAHCIIGILPVIANDSTDFRQIQPNLAAIDKSPLLASLTTDE